jgi:hypothetical protein
MANLSGIVHFVLWFTVLPPNLAQYLAMEGVEKENARIAV